MKATQLKCPACGSTDLEKLKWNEYRCSHCGSMLKLDREGSHLELVAWACPKCGLANPIGQRFCSQCGTKLTKTCPRCRALNYLDVRYCGSCGFAFRLWKAHSQLEAKLASLRQRLAQLQARQAAGRAAQRREPESCTMTLLIVMGLFILWPLFPLWLIWLFWKQQKQKKAERESAQLTREIVRLEGIKNGPPSQLEKWAKDQERAAEERRQAEERRRRAEEKRKAEEKQRRAEKAARKRIPPEKEAKGPEGSLQQWFKRQSSSLKIAILLGSAFLLLCLCTGLATMFVPPPKPTTAMVHVPAGEFLMGSNEGDPDAEDDEHPQHSVYVSEFWIDKTEITNAQYRKCVEAGTCRAPTTCDYGDPTYSDSSKADHPVVCVSWQDATTYCEWAGKRLPTEAEWEKAARGTDGRKYPWGNTFDGGKVNFCDVNCEFDDKDSSVDDGYRRTAPVGSYPQGASSFGALDMAGNVYEWCQDWYDGDYYASSPQHDPQGPRAGEFRVHRGSSWDFYGWSVRAPNRSGSDPGLRNDVIGFRCVSQSPPTTMVTPMPTATPVPTDTPARPTRPTSTPPAETILGESIRKQIYLEWVEAQNSKAGDEDVWQEIARRWGIAVDAIEDIVVEGLNKKWLRAAATATPVSPTPMPTAVLPTQPTTEIMPTTTPATLVGSRTEVAKFQITSTGVQENAPLIFKDFVVYRRHGAPDVDIFGYDLGTREEFLLVQRPGNQSPSGLFGRYLAYTEDTRNPIDKSDVRLLNYETGEDILIAGGPGNQSGGGVYDELVTYITNTGNGGFGDLYVYNIRTGEREFIDSNAAQPRIWGHNVVWSYPLGSGHHNIKGYDLQRKEFFEISSINNGYQSAPDICGSYVVWKDGRDGKSAIYEKNLDTGEETLVYEVPAPGELGRPVIAEKYIAWVHGRGVGAHDIFVQNRVTREVIEVSNDGPQQPSPTVPDIWEDTVVWMSWHTGNGDIYGATLK